VSDVLERRAVISGIGQSDVGRRLLRTGLDLTIEAAERAVADAGLTLADIDGVSTYPGSGGPFGGASGADLHDALRLELSWRDGGLETAGQLGAVHKAVLAVAAGLARHVLVFRTVVEGSGKVLRPGGTAGTGMGGLPAQMRFLLPFGAGSAANWIALYAMRHMHDYGTTREQLGAIAINGRRFAAMNPKAIYTEPMTMDDYLSVRMITEPFCLYDCDAPCDGSTAVVVSHRDFAPDAPREVAHVHAMGTALAHRPSWDQFDDLTSMPMRGCAAQLWRRADLGPGDVDVAQLYDGFSWLTLCWLESLGFCPKGESGPFVDGGGRIGLGGELPLNTWGGQLSSGRLHGFGFLHEAVVQLRGDGGDRQVSDAEVAVVAAGGGPECGCLLLTKGVR
jgi:acetyl-CoA acetyltransferase